MNNKDKKAFLTKVKLLISAGLLCTSLNVNANIKIGSIKAIGNPRYAEDLVYDFSRMPYEIDKYVRDNDINIYLLPNENSAEAYWAKDGYSAPSRISGYTSITKTGSDKQIDVFIEACVKPGYYEKYSNSSEGLTREVFNYRICKGTLMHELGHALDAKENYSLSDNKIFKSIYMQEKNRFKTTEEYKVENLRVDTNINTPIEYFATAFSAFICHPGDLYRKCPLTYCYIDNYAKEIASNYIDDINEIEEKYSNSITKDKNLLRNNYKSNINKETNKEPNNNQNKKNKKKVYYKKHKPNNNHNQIIRRSPRRYYK